MEIPTTDLHTRSNASVVVLPTHRALQRHIADTYLAPDVKFTHMLGDVQGREALYGVYRAAVSGLSWLLSGPAGPCSSKPTRAALQGVWGLATPSAHCSTLPAFIHSFRLSGST